MVRTYASRTPRSRSQMRARIRTRTRAWRNRARSRVLSRRRRLSPQGIQHFNRLESTQFMESRSIELIGGSGGDPKFTTERLLPFSLNKLVNYTDFQNLYSAYRLNKIVVSLIYGNDQVVQGSESTTDPNETPGTSQTLTTTRNDPLDAIDCYYFRDYDGTPDLMNGENAFRERQGVKRISMKKGKRYTFTITPAVNVPQWQAGPTLPGGNPTWALGRKFKQWINMTANSGSGVQVDGTTVPHHGFQLGFKHPNPGAAATNPRYGRVVVSCKYYFSCKGVS